VERTFGLPIGRALIRGEKGELRDPKCNSTCLVVASSPGVYGIKNSGPVRTSVSRDFAKGGILFQRRIFQAILAMCAAMALTQHCARAQQSYEVIVENGAPMKTRDGVTLHADIYRPKADGKFPVILMRTPYDKSVGWAASPAYQIAGHGYVVTVRDVRGRYTSEGEFYPLLGGETQRISNLPIDRYITIVEGEEKWR
jgi:X-Pro dipeptidyl-peptidase (S15 family)